MKKGIILLVTFFALCSCQETAPKDDLIGTAWEETDAASGWYHHCIEFIDESSFYYHDTGSRPTMASSFLWGTGSYSRNGNNLTFNFITDTKLLPSDARVGTGYELKLLSGTLEENSMGVLHKLVIRYTITHIIDGSDYETKEYQSVLYKTFNDKN